MSARAHRLGGRGGAPCLSCVCRHAQGKHYRLKYVSRLFRSSFDVVMLHRAPRRSAFVGGGWPRARITHPQHLVVCDPWGSQASLPCFHSYGHQRNAGRVRACTSARVALRLHCSSRSTCHSPVCPVTSFIRDDAHRGSKGTHLTPPGTSVTALRADAAQTGLMLCHTLLQRPLLLPSTH